MSVHSVAIQHEIRKVVVEARDKIKKDFDALPDYFSSRAGAVEKVAPRSSVENKEVSSKSNVTGGKVSNNIITIWLPDRDSFCF